MQKITSPPVNHLHPKGDVHIRYSIEELQADPFQWSLFIQAYSAMQQQKNPFTREEQTGDATYFGNIAGIHGLPNRPYPGETEKPLNGYCHHGIPTFPTWHRAYVKTIEQSLKWYADGVLASYDPTQVTPDILKKLTDANTALRFPYLDWDNVDNAHIITPIVSSETINITYSYPNGQPKAVTNPLKCFVNCEDYGDVLQGTFNNPASRPRYSPPLSTPYTPKGYPTIRHPTNEYEDDNHRMNLVSLEYHENTLLPGMYQMFQNDDYFVWSNHSVTRKKDHPEGYGLYSSIEVYHDSIHDAIGGNGGHMAFPPVAAFDPFFFLHHCNVDRLFALWQRCYPDKWFDNPDNYVLGSNYVPPDGALHPFYNNATNKNVTSNDLRNYGDWGYNYSGRFFDKKYDGQPTTLLADVLKYYGTNLELPYIYFVDVSDIDKNKYSGPYTIRVFIGDKNVDENTPTTSKNYAGAISVFSRGNNVTCKNCEGATIKGHVPINNTLMKISYDITVEDGQDLKEQSQLQTQISSFRDETVLIAVDNAGKLLYKWTVDSKLTSPTVGVHYIKNFVNDAVQNELVNEIKDSIKAKKSNLHIDTDKLHSMSGKQIINYIKKHNVGEHEHFLKKFISGVRPVHKKLEE